jgi:hypothetical protein
VSLDDAEKFDLTLFSNPLVLRTDRSNNPLLVTVYVMGVLVALDQGRQIDEAVMICIYGHKFIPLVLAGW